MQSTDQVAWTTETPADEQGCVLAPSRHVDDFARFPAAHGWARRNQEKSVESHPRPQGFPVRALEQARRHARARDDFGVIR